MDNFNTAVFNETQRYFIADMLKENTLEWGPECRNKIKNYFSVLEKFENLENIEIFEIQLIIEAICLENCNDLNDVRIRVLELYGYHIDDWDDIEDLREISDAEALEYLKAFKMLAKTVADYWQKQAA